MQTTFHRMLLTIYITACCGSLSILFYASTARGASLRDRVVIACISGRGGVPTQSSPSGMANLCDKLQSELQPLGINPANIFHRSWNHNESDNPFGFPWVSDLNREIKGKTPGTEPSYLALIGHSYGGWAASQLSQATTKEPDFVALVDPVFGSANIQIPGVDSPTGRFIKNWYQTNSVTPRDTCTGLGGIPCHPANNGISCGQWVNEAHENVQEEFHKDWNGNRKRTSCFLQGRVHVQTWHTMMDDNAWIWHQIRDRIFADLSSLFSSEDNYYQLQAFYQAVLGRAMDDSGWQAYSDALGSGWTLEQVRNDIAHSPEAYSRLEDIYQDVLGRAMDDSGKQGYSDALGSGWTLREVRDVIAHSPEAHSTLAAAYQAIWGRPIDQDDLEHYLSLLEMPAWTLAGIVQAEKERYLQTVVLPVLIAISVLQ